MRKHLFAALALFLAASGCAQFAGYPELPRRSREVASFIPERWEVLDECRGDLNNDGYPNIAMVLQSTDSIPAADPESLWSTHYYPRILVILLYDGINRNYRRAVQSNDFILTTEGDRTMEEPFRGIYYRENGTLGFDFGYWYSAGTWMTGTSTYIFRYQNHRFELIGQEVGSFHRGTGAETKISINYSTSRAILTVLEDPEVRLW